MAKMTEGVDIQPRQAHSSAGQAGDSTERPNSVTEGTGTAPSRFAVILMGSVTSMAAAVKVLGLLAIAVLPGGLLILAAFVLGRAVAQAARAQQGTTGRRFARAMAAVSLREVWTSAKQTL